MKIELTLKSPTVCIPVQFSSSPSSGSGGDAANGIPAGGNDGDFLVKSGDKNYQAEWKSGDDALGGFSAKIQKQFEEQEKKIVAKIDEKADADSTAEAIKGKLDKVSTKQVVYANDASGEQEPIGYNNGIVGETLVQRTQGGQIKANPASEDNDVVTLSQMNQGFGEKSSVTVGGKVVLEFPADTYVANAIAALVNSAPETLDTLAEVAKALGNDPNFATTILAEIGKKADSTTTAQAIAGKSSVKVGGQVVSEFDADTKMDRPNNATGAMKVISVNWNNTIGLQGVGSAPQADRIAMFTSRKTLQTEAATDEKDAVNLAQLNAAIGDIESVLDEMHEYAQELINGGSNG